ALFGNNSIYETSIKTWKVSSLDYSFKFDKEPLVDFSSATDLQLFTKEDTISIYSTNGTLYTVSNRWRGSGGRVTWSRVGFTEDQASAKLKNYAFDVRNSDFTADSAELSFPKLFDKPVLGKLVEKATTSFKGEKASYPRF